MSTERFKNVTSFVINLLTNKTIILLNLAEYRLILADVRPRRLIIRRYSARFRRIIVNFPPDSCCVAKFLQRSVDEKRLMRSQSESRVFEFLQPSVDEKHLMRSQSESQVFKFLQPSADENVVAFSE